MADPIRDPIRALNRLADSGIIAGDSATIHTSYGDLGHLIEEMHFQSKGYKELDNGGIASRFGGDKPPLTIAILPSIKVPEGVIIVMAKAEEAK